jgi:SAM-dependent methyltransferase/uncharacterized protein YbaR (Trm112 family)
MKPKLREMLVCPDCQNSFKVYCFLEKSGDVIDGILSCPCGNIYPIVGSIPRILPDMLSSQPDFLDKYSELIKKNKIEIERPGFKSKFGVVNKLDKDTQKSFGFQWSTFFRMESAFKESFLNYILPVKDNFFKGKLGMDAGCGCGRHIYYAAEFGAEMVGVDFSRAIETAYQNTKHLKNVYLIQGDIYNPPFRKEIFDFVYCLGVLHHLTNPESGFRKLITIIKPKAPIFIWVYSKKRKLTNFVLNQVRKISSRLPPKVLYYLSLLAALIDWIFFILPYKSTKNIPYIKYLVERITFERIKIYSEYSFLVTHTDWFDRFSAPIRFYYNENDLNDWAQRAGLKEVIISPTGNYGWRLYGEKPRA